MLSVEYRSQFFSNLCSSNSPVGLENMGQPLLHTFYAARVAGSQIVPPWTTFGTHYCIPGTRPAVWEISDPEKCDQMYESLARINGNVYRQRFPRVRDTSFTGVAVDECRLLLSGSMQQMDEEKKSLWKTLMERFSSKSPEDVPEKAPEK
uniref:Mitochondrial nucleoid factor 1 n=1 Tax=Amphiprion percula TaxID=161767 RepID=A0A3P8T3Z9_AMPPE